MQLFWSTTFILKTFWCHKLQIAAFEHAKLIITTICHTRLFQMGAFSFELFFKTQLNQAQ